MRKLLASLLIFLTVSVSAHAQCIGSLPNNLTNGTTADASQVMGNFNFIVSQTNANCATAGANSNITALTGLITPLTPGQGGSQVFTAGTSTGSANAQVVSSGITPTGFSLSGKNIACFTPGFTNTGATTLNYNSTGATNIFKHSTSGPIALIGGEIVVNNYTCAQFDGTQFELINGSLKVLGKQVSISSATTTDLGTALTNNILITGTTTITSFGSTAQIDFPIYFLKFNGALTLTYNASSLILPGTVNIVTATNDIALALYLGSGNWQIISYQRANSTPFSNTLPTIQAFTTGSSLTYTPTVGFTKIKVRMVGGGGGGGATNTNSGGSGNTTSFGGWSCGGGSGGLPGGGANTGGAGGSGGSTGSGTVVFRRTGSTGNAGQSSGGVGVVLSGGMGGSSPFMGAGGGGGGTTGGAAIANTGSGGGGGAGGNSTGGGAGGGSGEYVEFWMSAAQVGASQTYTVGTGGAGGTAGGQAGGAGAAGFILIEEFYN